MSLYLFNKLNLIQIPNLGNSFHFDKYIERLSIYRELTKITYNKISSIHKEETLIGLCIIYLSLSQNNISPMKINHSFSVSNHSFSVSNHSFSVSNHGFSISNHGFSVSNHGFSVSNHGFSVSNNGFSVSNNGFSEKNHSVFVVFYSFFQVLYCLKPLNHGCYSHSIFLEKYINKQNN